MANGMVLNILNHFVYEKNFIKLKDFIRLRFSPRYQSQYNRRLKHGWDRRDSHSHVRRLSKTMMGIIFVYMRSKASDGVVSFDIINNVDLYLL